MLLYICLDESDINHEALNTNDDEQLLNAETEGNLT